VGEQAERSEEVVVLVVEDDQGIRESLKEYLEESGYETVVAPNGCTGLAMMRGLRAPSVILLDLMMPDLDGWALRDLQRSDPALRDLPVIVLTAARVTEEVVKARCGDDVELVRKPFSGCELLEAIQRSCARADRTPGR
jgi:CheY-like chemotaxis protein